MEEDPHFKELLLLLNEAGVEYLIVGGYAVMKYSEPHYTKDLDIWVGAAPENAARLYSALAKLGAPLKSDALVPGRHFSLSLFQPFSLFFRPRQIPQGPEC